MKRLLLFLIFACSLPAAQWRADPWEYISGLLGMGQIGLPFPGPGRYAAAPGIGIVTISPAVLLGTGGTGTASLSLASTTSSGNHSLFIFGYGPGLNGTPSATEVGGSDSISHNGTVTNCYYSQYSTFPCFVDYVCRVSSGVTAISFTGLNVFSTFSVGAVELSGLSTGCVEGATAQVSFAAGTFTSSATVSGSSGVLGIASSDTGQTITVGSGFTSLLYNSTNSTLLVEYLFGVSTNTTVTATCTCSGGLGNIVIQ